MVLGIGSRVNFFSNVVSLGCGVKVGVDEDGSIGRDGGRAVKGGIKERGENTGKVSAKKYIFRDEENKNLIKLLSNNIIEYVRRKEVERKNIFLKDCFIYFTIIIIVCYFSKKQLRFRV